MDKKYLKETKTARYDKTEVISSCIIEETIKNNYHNIIAQANSSPHPLGYWEAERVTQL